MTNLCFSCPSIFSFQRSTTSTSVARKSEINNRLYLLRFLTSDFRAMVGLGRVELPTSPLSGVRSNHLSYRPVRLLCFGQPLVELIGVEPTTS